MPKTLKTIENPSKTAKNHQKTIEKNKKKNSKSPKSPLKTKGKRAPKDVKGRSGLGGELRLAHGVRQREDHGAARHALLGLHLQHRLHHLLATKALQRHVKALGEGMENG